ncbi:MAG: DMT family transporter [Clostridia bacterium]
MSVERAGTPEFGLVDLALIGVTASWGGNMIVIKGALSELPPMAFNVCRFGLALTFMWILLAFTERDFSVNRAEFRWLLLTGIVGNTLYQLFFINGINLSTAGNTAFMVATAPVWVAIIAGILRSERLQLRGWFGVAICLLGVAFIIFGSGQVVVLTETTVRGDLLTLAGACCWATYTLMTKPLLAHHSPLKVTAYAMTLGYIPFTLLSLPTLLAQKWSLVSTTSWLAVGYSAGFALTLGYVGWSWGVRVLGGTRTAIYNNLTPVVAGVLGYVFLREIWTPLRFFGAATILFGLYLVRSTPAIRRRVDSAHHDD